MDHFTEMGFYDGTHYDPQTNAAADPSPTFGFSINDSFPENNYHYPTSQITDTLQSGGLDFVFNGEGISGTNTDDPNSIFGHFPRDSFPDEPEVSSPGTDVIRFVLPQSEGNSATPGLTQETPNFSFTTTKRNKRALVFDGVIYHQENGGKADSDKILRFRCSKKGCIGRFTVTSGLEYHSHNPEHNHPIEPTKVGVYDVLGKIRQSAPNPLSKNADSVNKSLSGLSDSVRANLPPRANLLKIAGRAKKKSNQIFSSSLSLSSLEIPKELQFDDMENQFLQYCDPVGQDDRVFIFASDKHLDYLADSWFWFVDGTFKCCPPKFHQFWVVHGMIGNQPFPLAFCLLPGASTEVYTRVLENIRKLRPRSNPMQVMADFEKAEHAAFKNVFPSASVHGCWFHFRQALRRNIQIDKALSKVCKNDTSGDFNLNLNRLAALAFVPKEHYHQLFDQLVKTKFFLDNNTILASFVRYFTKTWIGVQQKTKRGRPTIRTSWNYFEDIKNDYPRTNNNAEGWHYHFSSLFRGAHPPLDEFLKTLIEENSAQYTRIIQLNTQDPNPRKRKKVAHQHERIKKLVEQYPMDTPSGLLFETAAHRDQYLMDQRLEYLNKVAFNIALL